MVWALLLLGLSPGQPVAEEPRLDEADLKAGFVYNFSLYVTWPTVPETEAPNTHVIGVVGDDAFAQRLERSLQGKTEAKHKLVVRQFGRDDDLSACGILVIGLSSGKDTADVLKKLRRKSVLTVSDSDGFCAAGGMIELVRDRGRFRLRINRNSAESAGLRISSKLLALATVVDSRPEGGR